MFIKHFAYELQSYYNDVIIQVEMEKTLMKMVCVLLFVWFVAWTPYAAMNCWILFYDSKGLSPILGIIPTICCKISAGSNALLYGIR